MLAALLVASGAAIAGTAWVAERDAGAPLRCAAGLVAIGPRCCGEGQTLSGDRCVGEPARCPSTHERRRDGCVARPRRVLVAGGEAHLGPSDWEAQGVVEARTVRAGALSVDVHELDVATHAACVDAGACRGPVDRADPGRAAALTLEEARALCRFTGARLPTDDEWTWLAMGAATRRYPWGDTGLVCSRAAFGLVAGPCARGARGPDLVGARPGGATPEGLQDLAGNLAEWATTADGARARGGSFLSTAAAELRGWRPGALPDAQATGARCVVDR